MPSSLVRCLGGWPTGDTGLLHDGGQAIQLPDNVDQVGVDLLEFFVVSPTPVRLAASGCQHQPEDETRNELLHDSPFFSPGLDKGQGRPYIWTCPFGARRYSPIPTSWKELTEKVYEEPEFLLD